MRGGKSVAGIRHELEVATVEDVVHEHKETEKKYPDLSPFPHFDSLTVALSDTSQQSAFWGHTAEWRTNAVWERGEDRK